MRMTPDVKYLFPSRDGPAKAFRRACHAPDGVYYQGVPNQFKNVAIAGAVAVSIGISQIESSVSRVGEDELTLATPVGQRRNQSAGVDGTLLFRLRREDSGHVQELRQGDDQEIGSACHKNELVARLSMRL